MLLTSEERTDIVKCAGINQVRVKQTQRSNLERTVKQDNTDCVALLAEKPQARKKRENEHISLR